MSETPAAAPETLTRKTLIGSSWSAASTGGRQILTLLFSAVLARILGPEVYGLMGMVALVGAFLLNFRDLGTTTAIIQRPSINDRLLSTIFWANAAFGLILCLVVLAAALPLGRFFKEPGLPPILAFSSISFIVSSAGLVQNAVMTRNMAFGKLGLTDVLSSLGGYAVAIPCAVAGLGVWSLVLANLANAVISTAMYWYFAGWTPRFTFDLAELRSVSSFSLNLSGAGILNYFARNADNVVVGKFLGGTQLGFYQMAYNLMLYPLQNVSFTISQVLRPALSRIQDEQERFRSAYLRSCMLIGLITFPLVTGMGILADPLIRAVLGPKWTPVIPLFQILAAVGLMQSVHTTAGLIYVAKARTDLMLLLTGASTAVFIVAFLIGVRHGTIGVAAAYGISYFGLTLYPSLAVAFRLIGLTVSEFFRSLLPQLGITAAMAVACILWLGLLDSADALNPWLRLVSGTAIGAFVYIFLMVRSRPAVILHLEDVVAQSGSTQVVGALRRIGLFPSREQEHGLQPAA